MLLVIAWVPGFAWNMMRFRETVMFASSLDRRFLVARLNRYIPRNSGVCVAPELVSAAVEAGLCIKSMRFSHVTDHARPDEYVLLLDYRFAKMREADPDAFTTRKILYRGGVVPNGGPLDYRIDILGPRVGKP